MLSSRSAVRTRLTSFIASTLPFHTHLDTVPKAPLPRVPRIRRPACGLCTFGAGEIITIGGTWSDDSPLVDDSLVVDDSPLAEPMPRSSALGEWGDPPLAEALARYASSTLDVAPLGAGSPVAEPRRSSSSHRESCDPPLTEPPLPFNQKM